MVTLLPFLKMFPSKVSEGMFGKASSIFPTFLLSKECQDADFDLLEPKHREPKPKCPLLLHLVPLKVEILASTLCRKFLTEEFTDLLLQAKHTHILRKVLMIQSPYVRIVACRNFLYRVATCLAPNLIPKTA